jgi:hypothetical protein
LPTSSAALHGTAHCIKDRGYLFIFNPFIFNPSAGPRIGAIPLDHRIGLTEGARFVARAIYPDGGSTFGPYARGELLRIPVSAQAAMVLEVLPADVHAAERKPLISSGVPVDKAFLTWNELPWSEMQVSP